MPPNLYCLAELYRSYACMDSSNLWPNGGDHVVGCCNGKTHMFYQVILVKVTQ